MSKTRKSTSPEKGRRIRNWLHIHKFDVATIVTLVIIAGTISGINMGRYPQRFEDEGTYVSQSWAIKEKGQLSHYTYWYDHPPAGWIQMAGHLITTDATNRYDSDINAGREFMLFLHLTTIVLLFGLARRIGIGSLAAAIGVLVYALSPLVIEFSRYVLLDNVALPWLLAAFFLALSPRKHIMTAIGSAVCMTIAVLSKETFVVLLPVVAYGLWQAGDKRNRRYTLTAFAVVFAMMSSFYVLYAVLKNELIPGKDHVSLLGTLAWQLFGREGSGSIFESSSSSRGLMNYWLSIDYWLMLFGVSALPIAFFYRRLRIVAMALLVGLLMLLRTGYLPYPYIVVLLPFAALVFAGVLHYLLIVPWLDHYSRSRRLLASTTILGLIIVIAVFVIPVWQTKITAIVTTDQDASSRQAVSWISQNINRENRIVVESALWTDLQDQGFNRPDPVWLYKTETDPAVTKEIGGWQGIDYVILNGPTIGSKDFDKSFPLVKQVIDNSKLVMEFGEDNQKVLIYKAEHKN